MSRGILEYSSDYLSITFKLKQGVKFHNGEAFTSEDVVFSFDTYAREDKQNLDYAEIKEYIKAITPVDEYTVRFDFNKLYIALFDRLCDSWFMLPKDYYSKDEAYFADHPVGTGPYRWIDYQQDVKVNYEAVENHWRQTPQAQKLEIQYVPEASTRLAMLLSGQADIVDTRPGKYSPGSEY